MFSHKISSLALLTALLWLGLPAARASSQTNVAAPPAPATHTRPRMLKRRLSKRRPRATRALVTPRATPPVTPPVALVRPTPADYLSGEANVNVRGNQNPIVRLGLAQHGVTIVEFPVADRFFAIHPGNSNLVTVDDSPTKTKDHFMVLRAGSGFVAPAVVQGGARQPPAPATSIVVQMQSGMVLTFMVYPVAHLSQQAHRCVINYQRAEVIAARRAAGLAVNLDGVDPTAPQLAAVTPTPAPTPAPARVTPAPAPAASPLNPASIEIERRGKKLPGGVTDPGAAAQSALRLAIKEPKQFKRWTPPVHGLALSTVTRDLGEQTRVVIVAVRNVKAEAVRIMAGHPDLSIETLNERGQPVQVEQIKKLHTATTTTSSVLPAGAIVYYAVVYDAPVIGAKQHLRVAVGQTNAADEPAAADLTAAAR